MKQALSSTERERAHRIYLGLSNRKVKNLKSGEKVVLSRRFMQRRSTSDTRLNVQTITLENRSIVMKYV